MSKGTQMRKFRTFKEAAQKIVIKKPWGVEVKSYKAGDPIPAGVEFKIFDANDTAKIEAYADGLDESADYQKERFKEPYYMYNESKKVVENKMVGIISLPVGSKFIDDSFGGKRTLEVIKHGNDDVVHVKEVGTGRKFAYDASTPGGNKKVEKIEEGFLITGPSIEGKTFYVRSKDGQGTTFDRSNAFIFNSEKEAKDTIEKMKKAGYYTDKIEVIKESQKESVITESKYYIKRNTNKSHNQYFGTVGGLPLWGDKQEAFSFDNEEKANKYMKKYDYLFDRENEVKVVKESHISKGKPIKEAYLLVDTDTNNKPVYFHWGKYTGIDWWDDKKMASRFSTKEQAERWIEKMRQEGAIIKDMKIVQESRIAKGYENLNADEKARHLLSHPTSKYMSDLKSENITERAIRKAVKEMLGKPDKRDPQFIIDVNEGCIKESTFYVKFSQDGKSSKYYMYNNGKHGFTDDKSKATKFSTKEEAEKTFKKNPYYDAFNMKYFDIVSEEGEAPAIANTTAEVANPELPLKLKESVGQKLNISLVRKAQNLKEVEKAIRKGESNRVKAVVDKSYKLSENEYDKFVYNFMVHTTYLSGEGGVDSDGTVHVVEITAPDRKTIYVDPEGYDYARYVGY